MKEDVSEKEVTQKSASLKQIIDFAEYQDKEIKGTDKAYIIIAVDGDADEEHEDGMYSLDMLGGSTSDLYDAVVKAMHEDSPLAMVLREAAKSVIIEEYCQEQIDNGYNGYEE